MSTVATAEETLERLYSEFIDCIRGNNPEMVRDTYRRLMHAGRPLAEILDTGIKAAAGTRADFEDLLLGERGKTQTSCKETARTTIVEQTDPAFIHSGGSPQTPTTEIADAAPHVGAIKVIFYSRILWFSAGAVVSAGTMLLFGLASVLASHETLEKPAILAPLSSLRFARTDDLPGPDTGIRATSPKKSESPSTTTVETATRLPDTSFAGSEPQTLHPDPTTTSTVQKDPAAITATAVQGGTPRARPILSSEEISALLTRGDSLFALGDVASARQFYERAAEAGEGGAALRLGESYDPSFLRLRFRGMRGDRSAAQFWYLRARELGASGAVVLLKSMQGE